MSTSLFSKTPAITVLDNRGLTVRDITYHRHPDALQVTTERITRHRYDSRNALTESADPRLYSTGRMNFISMSDLSGSALRSQGADNGTSVSLNDIAGRPFISVHNIVTADDGTEDKRQTVTRRWQYENECLPGRLLSITEQVVGKAPGVKERFVYAGSSVAEKNQNLSGHCISHYDTAGLVLTNSIALAGVPLSSTRRLLNEADKPDFVADWQGNDVSAWNKLLSDVTFITRSTVDATGEILTTIDAKDNAQRIAYDVAGMLSGSWMTLKGGKEQVIVASLTYSAAGQKLREEHANGVVTTYTYEVKTQRLSSIRTQRPAGHPAGAKVLQDLRYEYDPVGNVLKVSNDAQETRFWRNQKVVPENTFIYDSLYQLVKATGREMANAGQQNSNLPSVIIPFPSDNSSYTNYSRTYSYDIAGNMVRMRHSAPAINNNYTTDITVSDRSNRAVLSTLADSSSGTESLFTAGGQQTKLLPGQDLVWTARNELLKVMPVQRDGGPNDQEYYRYDANSQRILKVSQQKTNNSVYTAQVLYLPGIELRTIKAGSTEKENLQIITIGDAGRAQVRVQHWEAGKPEELSNDLVRWSYDTLTGNGQLELDKDGNIISTEEYYPFGGTALITARNQTEVSYKTVRYSGKERDATGLYYYGYRYYQPWAGRWLSADPAGIVDGMNLFRMVRNNPIVNSDNDGLATTNHADLPAATPLSKISMLGSHDAGTYAYSRRRNGFANSLGSLLPALFKTQKLTLREQAKEGARYFDIRIAQNKNGSYSFFHGPSVAGGDALADVRDLMAHAQEDSQNFYLFKFVFKGDKPIAGATAKMDEFLKQALQGYEHNLIQPGNKSGNSGEDNLADVTVESLWRGKNLGVMVHKYKGNETHWKYADQVHSKWANKKSAEKTANFIGEFHKHPAAKGKVTVVQTNMPFLAGLTRLTLSVRSHLEKTAHIIGSAVDKLVHPGIMSADYIGHSKSAVPHLISKIKANNDKLKK